MYSPKIREDLIPRIYQVARKAGVPMTRWVNDTVETALVAPRQIGGEEPVPIGNKETRRLDQPTIQGGNRP
jgi:hypothetical protein